MVTAGADFEFVPACRNRITKFVVTVRGTSGHRRHRIGLALPLDRAVGSAEPDWRYRRGPLQSGKGASRTPTNDSDRAVLSNRLGAL